MRQRQLLISYSMQHVSLQTGLRMLPQNTSVLVAAKQCPTLKRLIAFILKTLQARSGSNSLSSRQA